MADQNSNGWAEWGRHVLAELERLDNCYHNMKSQNERLLTELTILKVKSGIWGIIGGAIPTLITIAVGLIFYLLNKGS